jgi:hypothetical protein
VCLFVRTYPDGTGSRSTSIYCNYSHHHPAEMSTNHIKKRENQVGGSNWKRERERVDVSLVVVDDDDVDELEKDRLKRETKQFDVLNYIKCLCVCVSLLLQASAIVYVCVCVWCNNCVFRWRWWSVVDTLPPPFFSFIHHFPPSWIYRPSWPLHSFDDDTRKFQFFRFRYNNHLPLHTHTHIRSTHTCITITTTTAAAAAFVH